MSLFLPSPWVSVPKLLSITFSISFPPSPRLRPLLPLSLSRTVPGSGSGNAAGSSSPAIASSITRVSAPAGVGRAAPHPFLLASRPSDPRVIPDPSPSFADSREESVLGSVLLPSYSVRPDGPGVPRGRRFTFTVSPSIPCGHREMETGIGASVIGDKIYWPGSIVSSFSEGRAVRVGPQLCLPVGGAPGHEDLCSGCRHARGPAGLATCVGPGLPCRGG